MNRIALVLLFGALAASVVDAQRVPAPQLTATTLQTPAESVVQQDAARQLGRRVDQLDADVQALNRRVKSGTTGVILFLFGAVCALWAQNTKRDPWLWFFLGAFFNVFAVISMLMKNAEDAAPEGQPAPRSRMWLGFIALLIVGTFLLLYFSSMVRAVR
ncbi:MAG: hypothetical protein WCQ64_11130 [Acidobacteriota bacterium]